MAALLGGLAAPALAGGGWQDLGNDLPGTHGSPVLVGQGHLIEDTPMTITLSNALAQTPALCVVGLSTLDLPFRGGTLVPALDVIFTIPTGGSAGVPSTVVLGADVPPGTPAGTSFYLQFWIPDAAGTQGFAASNAIQGTVQTLYDEVSAEVDCRLATAGNPGSWKKLYSTQDFVNQVYVRKVKNWVEGIDLTGLSPWNQTGGATRAGTLISPRHVAFAKHFPLSTTPGSNQIVFVTADDVTVTRSVVAVAYPGGDVGIGVLDQDVPPTIGFHKILPQNWATYLPDVSRLPMLHLDQEEKALVRDMIGLLGSNCVHDKPLDPLRNSFSEELISGDSGNPAFLLIGGEAVLILTHLTNINGPFYTHYFNEINAVMTSLGGGYQLTEFDFDAFLHQ